MDNLFEVETKVIKLHAGDMFLDVNVIPPPEGSPDWKMWVREVGSNPRTPYFRVKLTVDSVYLPGLDHVFQTVSNSTLTREWPDEAKRALASVIPTAVVHSVGNISEAVECIVASRTTLKKAWEAKLIATGAFKVAEEMPKLPFYRLEVCHCCMPLLYRKACLPSRLQRF